LFEGLREALKKTDDEDVVTPEQAQVWWGDYDRLMKELGQDWLRDYMREVWRKLEPRLSRNIGVGDVKDLLETFHPDLITQWTGTADEPGVIAKLFMAGMGAGQQALERRRTSMNPNKAAELNIDWSLVPSDAIKDVERYVKRLVGELDKTTLKDFERVLVQWLESGGTLDDLKHQLTPVFNDPDRADLIAVTEASNAYNTGAINRWEEVGVEKVKWQTVRDAKVCPICEPLHNSVATIDSGFGGEGLIPPAHGRCRCFLRPVLD
jgi:SPP1 gp7 family putative phage head morphogenesis protein